MIAGMLPYLQWQFGTDDQKKSQITKWFKQAVRARAKDAYWDPAEECVKNTSDKMLSMALADKDDLYWVAEQLAPDPASPKCKHVQIEEESLDNTVSMIKSVLSTKKTRKLAMKTNNTQEGKNTGNADSQTTISQNTTISQLTKQVNEIKQTNKMFLTRFNQLTKQMAALLAANNNYSSPQCPARGHLHESSHQP